MMNSTTSDRRKKHIRTVCAALLWVVVWQLAAMLIDQPVFIAPPTAVALRLWELLPKGGFWAAVWFSFARIVAGFFIALAAGVLLAAAAAASRTVETLLSVPMKTVRAVPVASFIIIALLWFSSRRISLFISFLMVLPIIYENALSGIRSADGKLLEAAEVFRVPFRRRVRQIYIPVAMPFFVSGCKIALGLCWKSGIAAEVIGQPDGSIGELLYQSKINIDTDSMLAWTVVIVIISIAFEKLFLLLVSRAAPGREAAK